MLSRTQSSSSEISVSEVSFSKCDTEGWNGESYGMLRARGSQSRLTFRIASFWIVGKQRTSSGGETVRKIAASYDRRNSPFPTISVQLVPMSSKDLKEATVFKLS